MISRSRAFTLIELMVVIVIVMILASVTIPVMRTRLDKAKWTEANTGAGLIRRAVKAHYAGTGSMVKGSMGDEEIQKALELDPRDLVGTYFVPYDYKILSVNTDGLPVIQVTGSQSNAPKGSRILTVDGTWQEASSNDQPVVHEKKPVRPPVSPML